ncbi:type II secretion system F family protein [Actinospica robiniae]|uniref:type II secretion system F family protein n=1 Tax=Actinospica robiniae TaxID=304901 RepID=UPI0004163C9A|nr:type II secretion system F family protein [Actinospica robiniae]
MILPLLLGAGVGAGLTLIVYGLRPPKPSLAADMASQRAVAGPARILTQADGGWAARFGSPLARLLEGTSLPGVKVTRDLAVLERSVAAHLAEKCAGALAGLLVPSVFTLVLTVAGIRLPWIAALWFALVCAGAAFLVPDYDVKAKAQTRRVEVRHALSAFLDLTVVTLSGGAGVESALTQAADTGEGWAMTQIRRAITAAETLRVPAAETLGQLGEELDVPALGELSASLTLAGTEGARVRASLAAKAASLRAHALSEADAASQSATERLSLPTMLMVLGFLCFLGYPAMAHIAAAM